MDTPSDDGFDRIVARAREALPGIDIAAVSLIDADRQWYKAALGIAVKEIPRAVSFCSHAIQGDEPFVVEDATKDVRFASNPLVTTDPAIRFYAGIPLVDGVGALCVASLKPRQIAASELKFLEKLAMAVNTRLALHCMDHKMRTSLVSAASRLPRR